MHLKTWITTVALATSLGSACRGSRCGIEPVATYPSPGDELKAVVFTRVCEQSSNVSTNVSILPTASVLRNRPGNVFVSSGRDALELQWFGRNRLVITHDSLADVSKQEGDKAAVRVEYRPR